MYGLGGSELTYYLGVPRCCGAFTPSMRVVSRRGGRGWFLFGFRARFGRDRDSIYHTQVQLWRRSFDTPPPECELTSEYWPGNDNKYAHIPVDEIPLSECLKDTVDRCLPYWEGSIVPALKRGKTVLVAAHGNSIRGILKYLDGISDDEITKLESKRHRTHHPPTF